MCGESILARRLPDGRPLVEITRKTGGMRQLPPHPDHFPREDLIGDWAGDWVQQHLFAQAVLYWALGDVAVARELADEFAQTWVKARPGGDWDACKDSVLSWVCVWLVRCFADYTPIGRSERKGVRHGG